MTPRKSKKEMEKERKAEERRAEREKQKKKEARAAKKAKEAEEEGNELEDEEEAEEANEPDDTPTRRSSRELQETELEDEDGHGADRHEQLKSIEADDDDPDIEEDDENIADENAELEDADEDEEEEYNEGSEPYQGDEYHSSPMERDRKGKIRLNKRQKQTPFNEDEAEELLVDDEDESNVESQDKPEPRGAAKSRKQQVEEVKRQNKNRDAEGAVQVRIVRNIGSMVKVGSWMWNEQIDGRPVVDETYEVPRFVAEHLASIGAAVPMDSDIKFVSSVRTNTKRNQVKFLR